MIRKPTKAHARKPGERVHSDMRLQKHHVSLQALKKPEEKTKSERALERAKIFKKEKLTAKAKKEDIWSPKTSVTAKEVYEHYKVLDALAQEYANIDWYKDSESQLAKYGDLDWNEVMSLKDSIRNWFLTTKAPFPLTQEERAQVKSFNLDMAEFLKTKDGSHYKLKDEKLRLLSENTFNSNLNKAGKNAYLKTGNIVTAKKELFQEFELPDEIPKKLRSMNPAIIKWLWNDESKRTAESVGGLMDITHQMAFGSRDRMVRLKGDETPERVPAPNFKALNAWGAKDWYPRRKGKRPKTAYDLGIIKEIRDVFGEGKNVSYYMLPEEDMPIIITRGADKALIAPVASKEEDDYENR